MRNRNFDFLDSFDAFDYAILANWEKFMSDLNETIITEDAEFEIIDNKPKLLEYENKDKDNNSQG